MIRFAQILREGHTIPLSRLPHTGFLLFQTVPTASGRGLERALTLFERAESGEAHPLAWARYSRRSGSPGQKPGTYQPLLVNRGFHISADYVIIPVQIKAQ